MKAPPSTPDQEASGCHLTQLPGLPACKDSAGSRGARGLWGSGGVGSWHPGDSGAQSQAPRTPLAPQELHLDGGFRTEAAVGLQKPGCMGGWQRGGVEQAGRAGVGGWGLESGPAGDKAPGGFKRVEVCQGLQKALVLL